MVIDTGAELQLGIYLGIRLTPPHWLVLIRTSWELALRNAYTYPAESDNLSKIPIQLNQKPYIKPAPVMFT